MDQVSKVQATIRGEVSGCWPLRNKHIPQVSGKTTSDVIRADLEAGGGLLRAEFRRRLGVTSSLSELHLSSGCI
jgi:hypothetical protein